MIAYKLEENERHMEPFVQNFDPDFYKTLYSDIKNFSDDNAFRHFIKYGIVEGRICSSLSHRKEFIKHFNYERAISVLEIGPFNNPIFTGKNVKYFDVLSSENLKVRCKDIGLESTRVPEVIHFVDPNGNLSIVNEKFELVIASHVIEHQPDLVSFLINVKSLLTSDGVAAFIVPDKRFCFDHYIPTSNILDVLSSYVSKDKTHSLYKFFLHRLHTVHNDPVLHWWGGWHGNLNLTKERFMDALDEWNRNRFKYIDVHSWFFTPLSLFRIFQSLRDLGLFNYKSIEIFNTPKNQLEFCFYFK